MAGYLLSVAIIAALNFLPNEAGGLGTRIIGGSNAIAGQFPFTAAIYITTNTGRYFCSGTLISNEWIVTAAQCLEGAILLSIEVGSTSLTNDDPNRLTVATSDYFIHPAYDPLTVQNDIGLIQLRIPIQFSNYVLSVSSLPEEPLGSSVRVVILGWGQTSDENGELSDSLRYVAVSTLSTEECRATYGNQITEQMICVAGNNNEGACLGDTGSPLIRTVTMGQSMLVGLSSFTSSNGCESEDPSGYTRLSPYLDWISNVTGIPL